MTDSNSPPADQPVSIETKQTAKRGRRIEITVNVNLNGTPVPATTAPAAAPALPAPPPPQVSDDPPPPVVASADDSVPPITPDNLPWYSPKHLLKVLDWMGLELAAGAKHFYKSVSFWFFTVVGALPDIYNMAISSHYITADKIPDNVTNIINMIAFFGAAVHIIHQKRPADAS